ncbi:hypothetical protein LIA77_06169 [Sarocladium implicatum]|nr:hypothetical protein LIA77_06169 [Sarocladium implicatum]
MVRHCNPIRDAQVDLMSKEKKGEVRPLCWLARCDFRLEQVPHGVGGVSPGVRAGQGEKKSGEGCDDYKLRGNIFKPQDTSERRTQIVRRLRLSHEHPWVDITLRYIPPPHYEPRLSAIHACPPTKQ